jgi:hypothetical protein
MSMCLLIQRARERLYILSLIAKHTVGVQKYLLTPRVAKPMSKQYFDAAFKTRILKLY